MLFSAPPTHPHPLNTVLYSEHEMVSIVSMSQQLVLDGWWGFARLWNLKEAGRVPLWRKLVIGKQRQHEAVGFTISPVKKPKKLNAGTQPDSYIFTQCNTAPQGNVPPMF